MNYFIQ